MCYQKYQIAMDEPFKHSEDLLKKMIKDAGLSKPSSNFAQSVLASVQANSRPQPIYRPLLSKKVWIILLAIILIAFIGIYYLPFSNEQSLLEKAGLTNSFDFRLSLPDFRISRTLTYAIGFMALFLIQIPFLKRYLEKAEH